MTEDVRLRPPEDKEKFIEGLIKDGLFETKQAALMFGAALGFYRNQRQPLSKAGEGVRWQVFERNQDTPFIYALAVAFEKSINVLEGDSAALDKVCNVFEQSAAAGFEFLQQHLATSGEDALNTVLLLLAQARDEGAERPIGLEGVSAGALDLLGL